MKGKKKSNGESCTPPDNEPSEKSDQMSSNLLTNEEWSLICDLRALKAGLVQQADTVLYFDDLEDKAFDGMHYLIAAMHSIECKIRPLREKLVEDIVFAMNRGYKACYLKHKE